MTTPDRHQYVLLLRQKRIAGGLSIDERVELASLRPAERARRLCIFRRIRLTKAMHSLIRSALARLTPRRMA